MRGSVSSFAYQGTNSHLVLGAAPATACDVPYIAAAECSPLKAPPPHWLWQRSRLWYQPTAHPLLHQFARRALGGTTIRMQCQLAQAALSYLRDHSVQGRGVAPNSLLLEMAAAAGQLLWSTERSDNPAAVVAATFQQPLLLPLGTSAAADPLLTCTITPASGTVALSSQALLPNSQAAPPVHMQGRLHNIAALQTAPQLLLPAHSIPPAANRWPSNRLAAMLLAGASPGMGVSSSSAAFAAVLAGQHAHTGYFVHPAVADASLQLAAALRAPGSSGVAEMLVLAAMGAYAPMVQLSAGSAGAGAAVGLGGRTSTHWLAGAAASPLLSIVDNQFKTLAAMQSLAAAAAAAAAQLPAFSPAGGLQPLVGGVVLPAGASLATPAPNLESIVRQLSEVAAGLLDGVAVPADQPLMEAGLDSIGVCCCWLLQLAFSWQAVGSHRGAGRIHSPCTATGAPSAGSVELKNAVSAQFGIELPATVTFDYPTVQAMAGYIAQQLQEAAGSVAGVAEASQQDVEAAQQAVLAALLQTAAELIGAEVAPDQPLMEAGLDSIGVPGLLAELFNKIWAELISLTLSRSACLSAEPN